MQHPFLFSLFFLCVLCIWDILIYFNNILCIAVSKMFYIFKIGWLHKIHTRTPSKTANPHVAVSVEISYIFWQEIEAVTKSSRTSSHAWFKQKWRNKMSRAQRNAVPCGRLLQVNQYANDYYKNHNIPPLLSLMHVLFIIYMRETFDYSREAVLKEIIPSTGTCVIPATTSVSVVYTVQQFSHWGWEKIEQRVNKLFYRSVERRDHPAP